MCRASAVTRFQSSASERGSISWLRGNLYPVYVLTYGRDIEALICMVRSGYLLLSLQPPTILRSNACEIRPVVLLVHDYSFVMRCARLATCRNMANSYI
jgi:hypothetical protein